MTALDRPFEIVGVVVLTANDDQVLATADDVELAVAHGAEVPGAEERLLPRRQAGAKGFGRVAFVFPVSGGDARPGHPYLAEGAVGQLQAAVGIDDRDSGGVHR